WRQAISTAASPMLAWRRFSRGSDSGRVIPFVLDDMGETLKKAGVPSFWRHKAAVIALLQKEIAPRSLQCGQNRTVTDSNTDASGASRVCLPFGYLESW